MSKPIIEIKNFNLGGIADSLYQGASNSLYAMVGFDIHNEPGILKVNQKLTKESGETVDDFVKKILPCSDGNTYLFGSTNGKIWKRTSAGVYSLEATASPAAGAVGIMDAAEYQGYIYYTMQSRIGRVAVGAPTAWAGRDDSWATFTNTDADFHPLKEKNRVLYCGDANYIAQIDAGVFSANALDLKIPFRVKCFGEIGTDLLIGTYITAYKNSTNIFRWNTWSLDFQVDDPIPEIGINAFLATDNFSIANCGKRGQLYLYTGAQLEQFKKIPGSWSEQSALDMNPNAVFNKNGLPLFGLSYVDATGGNPALQGIYSLGGYDRNYPKVLNLEWLISSGNSSKVQIGAIEMVGGILLVSWKDTTTGTVYGVDKLDTTAKTATAYFETRQFAIDRKINTELSGVVAYRSLPANCSINIYCKANYAASWGSALTVVNDTDRKLIYLNEKLPEASTIQIKVEVVAYLNTAPEIEGLFFDLM